MHLPCQRLGRFLGRDADGFAPADIHKRRGNLSPVTKLQRALAQAATSDHRNSIGGAAVNLNEGDESLAVLAVWIVDSEFLQAEHREPHAENLPGTEMSVGLFSVADVFIEGFHKFSCQLSALSLHLYDHFLCQRTPSFVISTITPASVSCARITSEALKARARGAASISAIFSSMS